MLVLCALVAAAWTGCKGSTEKGSKESDKTTLSDDDKRARTSEAIDGVDRLYKTMMSTTMSPKAVEAAPPCGLPATSEWTPAGNPCDDGDPYFSFNRDDWWNNKPWSQLDGKFEPPGAGKAKKHLFRYRLVRAADGLSMQIIAQADQDCDGKWSTFKRVISVEPGKYGCKLKPSSKFEMQDELE